MKKGIKIIFAVFALVSSIIFTCICITADNLSESYKINKGEELIIDSVLPITAVYNGTKMSQSSLSNSVGETFKVDLKIFGVIPFSTVNVEVVDEMYVSVLGNPFGMKIYTDGVLVIEISDVETEIGIRNPANESGIKVGDYIRSVNGQEISCNEDLSEIVLQSEGKPLSLEIVRDGKVLSFEVNPVKDKESKLWRVGIWVRDSSAGIGTLTFYSPTTDIVCGLGHGICDTDTGGLLTLETGELVSAEIISIEKGGSGTPGALKGKFHYETIADILLNNENGVYGFLENDLNVSNLTEIALKQEIYDGKAQILCTVDGDIPKLYSCTIKKRTGNYRSSTQNFEVVVTDNELLTTTGGIVQGMSGSPVLQDGKLIGALTHVLVDDPTKGYGIFAENMLETAQSVANR